MSRLAARTDRIDASGIRKVFDLAKSMKNPINLSIGQPDFDVPPEVKKAAHEAIDAGRNSYTPTQGAAELRQLLLDEERAVHRAAVGGIRTAGDLGCQRRAVPGPAGAGRGGRRGDRAGSRTS